ncbi:uncharacterized protein LOC131952572 [Physella acuta]|uniref:uncharacterized protein LOC131952572 n=1 Tax=Physella acuta TaxID=109671 RepID=UPI0027DAF745|nr:uncharacterized protein LOC131952572 [Physella acuta]
MFRSLVIFVLVLHELTVGQNFNTTNEQLEPISDGEVEYGEKSDAAFDEVLLSLDGRPVKLPKKAKIESLYSRQYRAGSIDTYEESRSRCERGNYSAIKDVTRLADVNLYVQFLQYQDWYGDYKKCCPASQNYGCRSVKRLLPCFRSYVTKFAWCCPLERIAVVSCNCGKCGRFDNYCFYIGQCQRRFTYTRYAAVCYDTWWRTVMYFVSYLPTSCYCRLT